MKTNTIILIMILALQLNTVKKTFCQFIKESTGEELSEQTLQSDATKQISDEEYNISFDKDLNSYQSPNRNNNSRFIYDTDGFTATVRQTRIPLFDESDISINDADKKFKNVDNWKIDLQVIGFTKSDYLIEEKINSFKADKLIVNGNKAFAEDSEMKIDYENTKEGMRQNFTVKQKPAGNDDLKLILNANTNLRINILKKKVDFRNSKGKLMMDYSGLKVYDATGKILNAYFKRSKTNSSQIIIYVKDKDALYPVTIDPLSSSPVWTSEGNQASANYGLSVAPAGDVNNDGYPDLIIGAPYYDNGFTDAGKVFLYYGSSTGLSNTPNWTAESDQAGSRFGTSVSSAGDVNGDGISDILIGALLYNNGVTSGGSAFLWYGSSSGLGANGTPSNADWKASGNQNGAGFGVNVASAGKVNNDIYGDIIISSQYYANGQAIEGAAFVWYGSATGPTPNGTPANANWFFESNQFDARMSDSKSVGDVNGDGYSDVMVGAYRYDNPEHDEGKVFLFYGSPSGLGPNGNPVNADWSYESNQADALLGNITSSDVNNDGFSDVIVGALLYDNGQTDEGKVFAFYGSSGGLPVNPNWNAEVNQSGAYLGSISGAGDVNCDGYQDIIVGAKGFDNPETDEGRVFLYYGSASGLLSTPAWTAESNQGGAQLGYCVAGSPSFKNSGCSNVIAGAPYFDNANSDAGKVYVYADTISKFANDIAAISCDWPLNNISAQNNMIPMATFKNAGSSNNSNISVRCIITGPVNYSNQKVIPTLNSGDSIKVSFSPNFNPVPGTYTVSFFSSFSIDPNRANDTIRSIVNLVNLNGGSGTGGHGYLDSCKYWFANSQATSPGFPSHPTYSWKNDPASKMDLIKNGVNMAGSKLFGGMDDGYFRLSLKDLQILNHLDTTKKLKLCGTCYDSLFIGTNGIIGFTEHPVNTTGNNSWLNYPGNYTNSFLNGKYERPAIYPLWKDFDFSYPDSTGGINGITCSISYNQLLITYSRAKVFNMHEYVSFQICFDLTDCSSIDPNIKFTYGDLTNNRTSLGFILNYKNSDFPGSGSGTAPNIGPYLVGIAPPVINYPYILYRKTGFFGNMASTLPYVSVSNNNPLFDRPLYTTLNGGLSVEFGSNPNTLMNCNCNPDTTSVVDSCSCINGLLLNYNFANNPTEGDLFPSGTGQAPPWNSSYGSPQVVSQVGCCDSGYIRFWGNQANGEVIEQQGLNIQSGKTYKISMCARLSPNSQQMNYGRIGLTFTNGISNTYPPTPGSYNGLILGGNAPSVPAITAPGITTTAWVTYVYNWTSDGNYNTIHLNPLNDNNNGGTESVSWMDVDNICIQEIPGSTCDTACSTDSLKINTGFDHSTNSLYPGGSYDEYWKIVSVPSIINVTVPRDAGVLANVHPAWGTSINSSWLSVDPNNYWQPQTNAEPYIYETKFCVCENNSIINFDFAIMTDDEGFVYIDNVLQPGPAIGFGGQSFYNFNKTLSQGEHKLQVYVTNAGPTGINVSGYITGTNLVKRQCCSNSSSKCDSAKICAKTICPQDSFTVCIANSNSPYNIIQCAKGYSDSLGCTYYKFPDAVPGVSYYIVVKSKNSIEIWSAEPHVVKDSICFEYDFTSDSSKAYGNNMTNINGVWTMLSGDVNQDGVVDLNDIVSISNDANSFETGITDLNCDGITDLDDLLIAYNNAKKFAEIKKP